MRKHVAMFRLSKEEKDELNQQAEIAAITVSDYIRRRIYGHVITSKADLKLLGEIRRQGGLLKDLYNKTKGMYSEEFSRAIRANEAYYYELKKNIGKGGEIP